jgi:nitric oxide reductase subunit B
VERAYWDDRLLKISFFGFNAGLLMLTLGTLFPVGVLQTWVSFKEGFWVARDASFFMQPFVQFIGTVRVLPDLTIILFGVLPLLIFLFKTYPRLKAVEIKEGESVWERLGVEL